MPTQWLRRGLLLAASASALLLAACGGGGIASQFTPSRVVAFGDAMGDLGQSGTACAPVAPQPGCRYTVNDGANNWTQIVAADYGQTLTASNGGGLSYATGNARVTNTTDAAGNTGTLTVTQQIDTFLAGNSLGAGDLVLVSAGTSDVIAEVQSYLNSTESSAQMTANVGQAGRDLGAQVRRLVNAGARHVVVVGPYSMDRSPWALQTSQTSLMGSASQTFSNELLKSIVDLGADVLYVDAPFEYNLFTSNPGGYALSDVSTPVCTTIDAGPGIGTGPNQVNSNLCTPSTVLAGATYNNYLFADRVYPTPRGQQLFGDYAYSVIHNRW